VTAKTTECASTRDGVFCVCAWTSRVLVVPRRRSLDDRKLRAAPRARHYVCIGCEQTVNKEAPAGTGGRGAVTTWVNAHHPFMGTYKAHSGSEAAFGLRKDTFNGGMPNGSPKRRMIGRWLPPRLII
jgi:hypothetical protein